MSRSAKRTTAILSTPSSLAPTGPRPESSGRRSDWAGSPVDHHGGMPAQPGQQHLELDVGAVLRLIDDHEGVVQGAAAHEPHWRDLDRSFGHQRPNPLHRQPVGQGVVERAQIGGELVFHLARQKTDRFPGLDGGAGQDDPGHPSGFQGLHRLGDRQIGLAGARRAQGQDEILGVDGVHQLLLARRLGLDGLQIALLAIIIRRRYRRPTPINGQATDFAVLLELSSVERAFAQLSLVGSLARHESLHWGMKKGRVRIGPPLGRK